MVTIDDVHAVEIRIGTILAAEPVAGTDTLLKLSVDVGEEAPRQIISGIAQYVSSQELVGTQCPFFTNLEPRTIRGFESQGMIAATGGDEAPFALLRPSAPVAPGERIK